MENPIVEKSFDFAVKIVKIYKYLYEVKHEYVLSKQMLKSGTSIGANVSEAQRGQTNADFGAKMNIALKEASETMYWLRLLYCTDYLTKEQYDSIYKDASEVYTITFHICNTIYKKNI